MTRTRDGSGKTMMGMQAPWPKLAGCLLALALWPAAALAAKAPEPVKADALFSDGPTRGGFALVAPGKAPTIVIDAADARVVRHAAEDLAEDIKTVTGQTAPVSG